MPLRAPFLRVIAGLAAGTLASVVVSERAVSVAQEPAVVLPECIEPGPCVYVSPDPRTVQEVGRVYTFEGQGWRRGRVRVTFSDFCPPDAFCDADSITRTTAVDEGGRFTFRLRYAGRPTEGARRGPDGDPRGVDFEQRRGRRRVRRDAIPPPPPSTPEQLAEARAVAGVVARAHRGLERRDEAAANAAQRTFRAVGRCLPDDDDVYRTEARGAVADGLLSLAIDRATYAVVDSELRAFGAELGALGLTDPELLAAAQGWKAAVERPRPWTVERACTEHRRWRRAGYPADRAPIDVKRIDELLLASVVARSEPIATGGARLRALRGGRVASRRFGGGLLEGGDLEGTFG